MRYELSDNEWSAIKPMLPNKPRGVPRVNDRRVINGIFWVLRSGPAWNRTARYAIHRHGGRGFRNPRAALPSRPAIALELVAGYGRDELLLSLAMQYERTCLGGPLARNQLTSAFEWECSSPVPRLSTAR